MSQGYQKVGRHLIDLVLQILPALLHFGRVGVAKLASLVEWYGSYEIRFNACYVWEAVDNLFNNISRTGLRRKMVTVRFC